MKRRIDVICAVYMALILCLIGVGGFLMYQQERVISECRNQIIGLYELESEPVVVVEYVHLPPETVAEAVYIDKPVYRIVERVIIEEKEVEVITYKNIRARNWESVEQFEQWYEDLDFRVLLPSSAYTVDCDDYSERLQRLALQQGYSVSEAMAKNHLYAGVWVIKISGLHAGNLVLIGNDYYWVEPQPDEFNIKQLFERD